jgi:hypothetical protein
VAARLHDLRRTMGGRMGVACEEERSGGGGGTHREERDDDEAEQGDVAHGEEEGDQRDKRETWTAESAPPRPAPPRPASCRSAWADAAPPDESNESARAFLVRVCARAHA